MKILWTFTLLMIPGVVSAMRVTGYSGGGVTIRCKYKEKHTANEKYFCKGQWSGCTEQIRTNEKNKWVHSGRFSLYDDTTSAVFTVTFRDLKHWESGIYHCGTGKIGFDPYTEVNLEVITDQQIRSVRGYSGGNVIINFKYEKQEETPLIDICKSGADPCFPVIHTDRAAEWKHDRRFSVHEVRSAGLLRVFIRELNENDSGKYKIIVTVSEDYSFSSEFNLNIKKDDCVKSISLSAAAGGSVNISCKYPQSHRSDVKFLCWRSGADLCAEETSVKESRRWIREGKIQLYDDRDEQLLMGIISHVTEQHSEYWCGVQSDGGHKSFITRVLIDLTETNDLNTPYPPSSSSSSSPSSSSSSSSSVSVKTQMITEYYNSSVIFISELLVLLLFGVLMFLMAVRKNKQTQGLFSDEVTQVSCSYVIVSKTALLSDLNDTDTRTTVVYSAVPLPINPSDGSELLWNIQ